MMFWDLVCLSRGMCDAQREAVKVAQKCWRSPLPAFWSGEPAMKAIFAAFALLITIMMVAPVDAQVSRLAGNEAIRLGAIGSGVATISGMQSRRYSVGTITPIPIRPICPEELRPGSLRCLIDMGHERCCSTDPDPQRQADANLLAELLVFAVPAVRTGDAEQLAGQLAELTNASSDNVRCTPRPSDQLILCTAEGGSDLAVERSAAYLARLLEALETQTDALEGWTVIAARPEPRAPWHRR